MQVFRDPEYLSEYFGTDGSTVTCRSERRTGTHSNYHGSREQELGISELQSRGGTRIPQNSELDVLDLTRKHVCMLMELKQILVCVYIEYDFI